MDTHKLQTYMRHHRIAVYSILAFLIVLTYLLIVVSQQVSNEQALQTESLANNDVTAQYDAYPGVYDATPSTSCSADIDFGPFWKTQIGGKCWERVTTITCSNGTVYNNRQVPPGSGGCWTESRWRREADALCGCSSAGETVPTQQPANRQINQATRDCDVSADCIAAFPCDKIELPPTAKCSGQNACFGGGYYKSLRYRCTTSSTRATNWRQYAPGGCRTPCDLYKEAADLCCPK